MNLSKQEFLNTADSSKYIQDKRKLRDELEREMKKYIKRGGVIKSAENQLYQVKHGTSDQYKKAGCRCKKCMQWAFDTGLIKTTTLRERS